MILEAGLDPVRDLQAIRLTGSHNNSLSALLRGQVDVACLSFESFDKATAQGIATPGQVKVVARSIAIPNPPIAMSTGLAPELKAKLKDAFASVSTMPGVTPDTIRGYGGRKVDGYDASFPESEFAIAGAMMESINDELRGEILRKAATP
jgi:phosphonate transport system substrate-binding protein